MQQPSSKLLPAVDLLGMDVILNPCTWAATMETLNNINLRRSLIVAESVEYSAMICSFVFCWLSLFLDTWSGDRHQSGTLDAGHLLGSPDVMLLAVYMAICVSRDDCPWNQACLNLRHRPQDSSIWWHQLPLLRITLLFSPVWLRRRVWFSHLCWIIKRSICNEPCICVCILHAKCCKGLGRV